MKASIQFSSAETALKLDNVTPAAKGCWIDQLEHQHCTPD
jgi:hypothetical protein